MLATVLVIGAGHAGLAMSRCLAARSIDHVVIERGGVAQSWRSERWDSLRLLTPNWQTRLPGLRPDDADPHAYRTMPETVAVLERYAAAIDAPVLSGTTVTEVRARPGGYTVDTDRGRWRCRAVVIASGACARPVLPACAAALPAGILSLPTQRYRNPAQLPPGGVLVVGASASGVQIADELQRAGLPVTLAAGAHIRMPRVYRGRDIQWWMDATGIQDDTLADVDDIERARSLPSLQLAGFPDRRTLDLNALSDAGVRLAGRLATLRDGRALFSGSLANTLALSDLKMNRMLARVDAWIATHGLDGAVPEPERLPPTRLPATPLLALDLRREGIRTVIWATGYAPDHDWLQLPVRDAKGRVRHHGGIVDAPGLYLLGMPFLRRRKSTLIDGAGEDARELSAHLADHLAGNPLAQPVAASAWYDARATALAG
jgi:putative flavoprotein involved in K+ transport